MGVGGGCWGGGGGGGWPYWKMDTGKHNFRDILLLFSTEKITKTVEQAADTCHHQMHTD